MSLMWMSYGTESSLETQGATPGFIRALKPLILSVTNTDTSTATMVPCIAYLTHDFRLIRLDRVFALPTGVLPIDTRARIRLNVTREDKDNNKIFIACV